MELISSIKKLMPSVTKFLYDWFLSIVIPSKFKAKQEQRIKEAILLRAPSWGSGSIGISRIQLSNIARASLQVVERVLNELLVYKFIVCSQTRPVNYERQDIKANYNFYSAHTFTLVQSLKNLWLASAIIRHVRDNDMTHFNEQDVLDILKDEVDSLRAIGLLQALDLIHIRPFIGGMPPRHSGLNISIATPLDNWIKTNSAIRATLFLRDLWEAHLKMHSII